MTGPHMSATVELACELIRRPSVTPDDAGCQTLLAERLARLGFDIQHLPFGAVSNFWARLGESSPVLVFAGHTDVVPPGPEAAWASPPFAPTIEVVAGSSGDELILRGRGAADMKGSLAAMLVAVEEFLAELSLTNSARRFDGSIAFLITSDEEGPALDGTRRVVETLVKEGTVLDYCIVGEPSSQAYPGDTLRNGRRGSLGGTLTLHGVQGHVAYPHMARNPIHEFAPVLNELSRHHWDDGDDFFPPTSLQFSNIHSGTGATNVIPGELEAHFNLRYNTHQTPEGLIKKIENILASHGVTFDIEWELSGSPFLTQPGELTDSVSRAIRRVTGLNPELSTGGGTSDGRFIAPTGCQVVELGPVNATIHQVNEWVHLEHLDVLKDLYRTSLQELLGTADGAASQETHSSGT